MRDQFVTLLPEAPSVYYYTAPPVEVKFCFYRRPDGMSQKRFNGKALARTNFESNDASRRQKIPQVRNDFPVGGQAIFAAIERKRRIVIANLGRKTDELSSRNIWRIGNDHIKTAAQGMGPIAAHDARALPKPETRAIFGCNHTGFV
jgi:hypothetical protein